MSSRWLFVAVGVFSIAVMSSLIIAQATDLRIGTWKLNLAKSKYTTGTPPKSQTLKFASSADGGFKFTVDTVPTNGQPTHTETVAKIDGKEYPVKGAQESALRLYTKTDEHTFTDVTKRNGKVAVTTKMVISPDGKTMTVIRNGVNGYGQKVNSVSVFDKQ